MSSDDASAAEQQSDDLIQRLHGSWLESTTVLRLVLLSVVVGCLGGVGSVAFRTLLEACRDHLFPWLLGLGGRLLHPVGLWMPAVGGLFAGILIYRFSPESKGHGVPQVMLAVAMNRGRIRPVVAVIKALASSLTLGSGGSAGSEGPIVQIGAALGSTLSQKLRLSDEQVRLFVGCGAAAGISSIFNAPVAGVFFALEVILSEFATRSFASVVLSSVSASIVTKMLEGARSAAFHVPRHVLVSPAELPFYFLLGIITAVPAVGFTKLLGAFERFFDNNTLVPEWVKPAIGGLGVGAVGLFLPSVLGVGYPMVQDVINGRTMDGPLLLMLAGAKLFVTCLTLGSGGSGGVFAPALFQGAMLGGAFGVLVHSYAPSFTGPPGAYALVGMASLFAAATHAPITAILIVFEMTGDYRIILPLMLATVVSTLISVMLFPDSIYLDKLKQLGGMPDGHPLVDAPNPLQRVIVAEAMSTDFESVAGDMPVVDLIRRFNQSGHHGFPVCDGKGKITGMVTIKDLEYAKLHGNIDRPDLTVKDIATTDIRWVFPGDTVHHALLLMGRLAIGRLPVVEGPRNPKLVGVLRRSDIIGIYNDILEHNPHKRHLKVGTLAGASYLELLLPEDSPLDGRAIKDLRLPPSTVLVSVGHNGSIAVPRGDTVLRAGDVILAYTVNQYRDELRRYLMTGQGVE